MIELFKNKKILILGIGREGLNTLDFLRKNFPKKIISIADQDEKVRDKIRSFSGLKLYLGNDYLNAIDKHDVIIRSPGIPLTLPALIQAKRKGKQISSQANIFFDLCPGKIIGVTGTKGKSTTSALIYNVLKEGKIKAEFIGNIGKAALSFLPKADKKTIFIFELSSHQLADLKKSPHIAVILNIVPEHLDYYADFNEYINAKKNITLHQKKDDYIIYNASYPIPGKMAQLSKAKRIPFYLKQAKCPGCFIKGKYLVYCSLEGDKQEKIIELKKVPLKGLFNLQNTMPAIIIGRLFNIPIKIIATGIKTFKTLEHRLEKVGIYRGITFYNDSLATIPLATVEAVNALGDKVETILLGGFDRKLNFRILAKRILASRIKTLILFPTTGEKIWKEIQYQGKNKKTFPQHFIVNNMRDAVLLGYKYTSKGKICLLSCASASFGLFKDYRERGNLFKYYIKKFAKQLPK